MGALLDNWSDSSPGGGQGGLILRVLLYSSLCARPHKVLDATQLTHALPT